MRNVVNLPGVLSRFPGVVIDSPGFIALAGALVKWEQRKPVNERANKEDTCRQFVKAEAEMGLRPVSEPLERSNRPPTDRSDDKKSREAYSIKHPKSNYGNECMTEEGERPCP